MDWGRRSRTLGTQSYNYSMKSSRKPEAGRAQTNDHQARILSAAAETFLERGFEETSTAEIARRAKVSKRELYSNFRDKRDILAAVITQLQTDIQSQADVSWSSGGDLRKVLTEAGTKILEFINSQRFGKLFRIVAAESFRDPVSAQKFYLLGPGAGRDRTAAFIRGHMKAGNVRKADALRAADDFLDLVISARHLTAVVLGQSEDTPPPRAHVNHAVEVFLRYYGTREDGAQPGRSSQKAQRDGKPRLKTDRALVRSAP
jgi:TetR/AcrR family transcriptional repressor of mexJK operon